MTRCIIDHNAEDQEMTVMYICLVSPNLELLSLPPKQSYVEKAPRQIISPIHSFLLRKNVMSQPDTFLDFLMQNNKWALGSAFRILITQNIQISFWTEFLKLLRFGWYQKYFSSVNSFLWRSITVPVTVQKTRHPESLLLYLYFLEMLWLGHVKKSWTSTSNNLWLLCPPDFTREKARKIGESELQKLHFVGFKGSCFPLILCNLWVQNWNRNHYTWIWLNCWIAS